MNKELYSKVKAELRKGISTNSMATNLCMTHDKFLERRDKVREAEALILSELAKDKEGLGYSDEKVARYIHDEHNTSMIAEVYDISLRTAQRWVKKYKLINKI